MPAEHSLWLSSSILRDSFQFLFSVGCVVDRDGPCYPPHPGTIHPEVLSQQPLLRIYLSLFPHLKETGPRNEVGQQEERARCVPADLRGGRELGSGAWAFCLHKDAQRACGTPLWISTRESNCVGLRSGESVFLISSQEGRALQDHPSGILFRIKTTRGFQEKKKKR